MKRYVMQTRICDSCGKVINDNKKRYFMKMVNINFRKGYFYKDLCAECYNKLIDIFFKDKED